MKKFTYRLIQCIWGFPQTLVGLFIFLILYKQQHFSYHGSIGTIWDLQSSASLGLFIFISKDDRLAIMEQITVHEYGHTIQSLILGPLYLPFAAFPSMLWCFLPMCQRFRHKHNYSYYRFFIEHNANWCGEKITKRPAIWK